MSGLIYRNGQRGDSINWFSLLAGPLLSAFVAAMSAGLVTYIGVQKEMATLSNDVNKMSKSVDKIASEQDSFFKSQYLPLLLKVEQQTSKLSELSSSFTMLKDEIRMYHPVGSSNERHNKRP